MHYDSLSVTPLRLIARDFSMFDGDNASFQFIDDINVVRRQQNRRAITIDLFK